MFIATIVVTALLSVALLGSAVAKLTRQPAVVESVTGVGVRLDQFWQLAALEIAGALGLVIGLFWWPLGIAAAIGVVLYFAGAVISHLRVKDGGFGPASGLLVFAVAALVLRAITA